ncbi:MFS transporter [Rhizobium sp. CRIBSB]|nr:MFS transporter [Rhizobium sp. CRIBSB]
MTASSRLSLQYVLLFGATGVSLPFAGLWLGAQGFDGGQIGLLLAAPMLARIATGPLIAKWADRFRFRRTPIALLGATGSAGYALAAVTDSFPLVAAGWFIGATAAAALIPLVDVLNLTTARREGHPFSVPRGFGSAAFVLANVIMGGLLLRASADAVVIWVILAGVLIALAGWLVLPPDRVSETALPSKRGDARRLLADPRFLIAILAVGCIQSAHAFYYGFSALIWREQGISEARTGQLWAFSVLIEIGFMWCVEPWRRRMGMGARTMLLIGAGAAVLRWLALASGPPLALLWPLQALHALSFAVTYLAGVQIVERLSPPGAHTAAQTLSSVVSAGVLMGLATLASGPLYDGFGVRGYLAMAMLAALGGLAALALRLGGAGEEATYGPQSLPPQP